MKTPKSTIDRIVKNALLSLFIYAIPVILMSLTFYLKGEKPWLKKGKQQNNIHQQNTKD